MFHLVIYIVIGWTILNSVRRWRAERRSAADMARRLVPRGPVRVVEQDLAEVELRVAAYVAEMDREDAKRKNYDILKQYYPKNEEV